MIPMMQHQEDGEAVAFRQQERIPDRQAATAADSIAADQYTSRW
jgi:hypothetical protein